MLRLPEGMRDRIAAAARQNDRSMNAEIVSRLEESLVDDLFEENGSNYASKEQVSAAEDFPPFSAEELDEMDRWNEAYRLTTKLNLLIKQNIARGRKS